MPQALSSSTLAILGLAALAGLILLVERRWEAPRRDPLLVAWEALVRAALWGGMVRLTAALLATGSGARRRGIFRRHRGAETLGGEAQPRPAEAAPQPPEARPQPAEAQPQPEAEAAPGPPQTPAVTQPEVGGGPQAAAGPPPPPTATRRGLDHIPLAPPHAPPEREEREQRRLRDRLRRGLRKTRDLLRRDVREIFGAGPVPESFERLEEILIAADVGMATAMAICDALRERGRELTSDTLPAALRETLLGSLRQADRRLRINPDGPSVWLTVGVNGTGKTTSVAKLAHLATSHGLSVCLAAADTFRAAAIEQLELWGERAGVPVIRQGPGADPGAVVFDAIAHCRSKGHDLLIVDTAGRLHTRRPLMEELRKVRRVIERSGVPLTECLLVLDATTGQNGITQARAFQEAVEVTGVVLAKLDGTAKGGVVIAIERELGIPVKAVGLGEGIGDLAPFDPEGFVDAILGDGHP